MQLFDSIPKTRITTKPSTKKKNIIYKETAALCEIFIMEDFSITNMSEYEITSTT